jgi:hypothetical protein
MECDHLISMVIYYIAFITDKLYTFIIFVFEDCIFTLAGTW